MKLKVIKNQMMEKGLNVVTIVKIEDGGETVIHTGEVKDTVYITFRDKINGIEKRNRYVAIVSENSHLGKLVEAALGEIPDELSGEDLLGRNVVIRIDYKQKDGNIYANVVGVQSIDSVNPSHLVNPEALELETIEDSMSEETI